MTSYLNKTFSVAMSSPKENRKPGSKWWERHVRCDGADCPKCVRLVSVDMASGPDQTAVVRYLPCDACGFFASCTEGTSCLCTTGLRPCVGRHRMRLDDVLEKYPLGLPGAGSRRS